MAESAWPGRGVGTPPDDLMGVAPLGMPLSLTLSGWSAGWLGEAVAVVVVVVIAEDDRDILDTGSSPFESVFQLLLRSSACAK